MGTSPKYRMDTEVFVVPSCHVGRRRTFSETELTRVPLHTLNLLPDALQYVQKLRAEYPGFTPVFSHLVDDIQGMFMDHYSCAFTERCVDVRVESVIPTTAVSIWGDSDPGVDVEIQGDRLRLMGHGPMHWSSPKWTWCGRKIRVRDECHLRIHYTVLNMIKPWYPEGTWGTAWCVEWLIPV